MHHQINTTTKIHLSQQTMTEINSGSQQQPTKFIQVCIDTVDNQDVSTLESADEVRE